MKRTTNLTKAFAITSCFILLELFCFSQTITTVAGGILGNGIPATSVGITSWGVATDKLGNIYVSDQANFAIRKINISNGITTVIAGNGSLGYRGDGGQATDAQLSAPYGVALDTLGNIYVADYYSDVVRMVNVSNGIITTIAGNGTGGFNGDGGPASAAELSYPSGIAVDDSGNTYIADETNYRIRKVTKLTGVITTVAGVGFGGFGGDGGPATAASLGDPVGVCLDKSGNIYIVDRNNNRVRKVTKATGIINTYAGSASFGAYGGDGGPATSAYLNAPLGIGIDTAGNIYISDANNERIRKVAIGTGIITTVAGKGLLGYSGNGGPADSAKLNLPYAVAIDNTNNMFIVDYRNYVIREVKALTNNIYAIAGNAYPGYNSDGIAAINAQLDEPTGLVFDAAGNLVIADNNNCRIRKINIAGIISTFAGNGIDGYNGDHIPATSAELTGPNDVGFDKSGNLYIVEWLSNRIRKINTNDTITTVAGTGAFGGYSGDGGLATAAELYTPEGLGIDTANNVFIADMDNDRIRKINNSTGIITSVAGDGSYGFSGDGLPATSTSLSNPQKVVFDNVNNMYIADTYNNRIRKVDALSGIITTIAGNGIAGFSGDGGPATAAELNQPSGVAIDPIGMLYVTDQYNNRIRKVDLNANKIYTIAGNGVQAYNGDGGLASAAALDLPNNVNFDASGNMYIADMGNNRIRKVTAPLGVNGISAPAVSVSLYPNPNNGVFQLGITNYQLGINNQIEVYNSLGEKIYSKQFLIPNSQFLIDLGNQAPGVYLYRVSSENGVLVGEGKFIIQ